MLPLLLFNVISSLVVTMYDLATEHVESMKEYLALNKC